MTRDEKLALLRARLGAPIGKVDFPTWLREQPPEVQNRALGRRRAERFRRGELRVERFTDPPGAPLDLEQLAAGVDDITRAGSLPAATRKET